MRVAIITKTGEQVEILTINGGWTEVQKANGERAKVRNGQLSGHTTIEEKTAPITAKAAKARRARLAHDGDKTAKVAKEPRKLLDPSERKNGVVFAGYLPQYEKYKAVVNGQVRRSIDKGDALAVALRGMELGEVYKTAAGLVSLSVADLKSRFEHLNPGMQRMSLGNMIRRVQKEAAK